jgi:hypothetical protein
MHTFAVDGNGNVDPVVDEKGDVLPSTYFMEGFGSADKRACVACFVPVLDNGYPCCRSAIIPRELEQVQ